jgi:hypothetical protein
MKNDQAKTIALAVASMFAADTGIDKAQNAAYHGMAKFLKAAPLNDADYLKAFKAQLFKAYGEDMKDPAQSRWNIISNARRVAHGGVKNEVTVKGKGVAALVTIIDKATTLKDLKRELSDAVPSALKGASGGKRKGAGKKAKADTQTLRLPKTMSQEAAFAAARKVLEFCMTQFVKPSDPRSTPIAECIKALA